MAVSEPDLGVAKMRMKRLSSTNTACIFTVLRIAWSIDSVAVAMSTWMLRKTPLTVADVFAGERNYRSCVPETSGYAIRISARTRLLHRMRQTHRLVYARTATAGGIYDVVCSGGKIGAPPNAPSRSLVGLPPEAHTTSRLT